MKSTDQFVIAIDAGTTTLAASLLDLASGQRIAARSALNPQRPLGADVVSRLAYACESDENLKRLGALLNEGLNSLVMELLAYAGIAPTSISRIAVAGNPAMEHFLLSLQVTSLAFPPYRPLFTEGKTVNTADLGWTLSADLYLFPLPGGFVGGDLVAFLFGQGVASPANPLAGSRLFLDIGTNGEMALLTSDDVYATSVAAGPAFEGGNLSCGMTASTGAISRVLFAGDRVAYDVIGGGAPVGVCGSGVMALVVELLKSGLLDATGRLLQSEEIPSNLANRVQDVEGQTAFVLYRDAERIVSLSQQDIRQFQLAIAAIRAGIKVLVTRSRTSFENLQEVLLTGSFGAILDPVSLRAVGILDDKIRTCARSVADGVLCGVEKMLLSPAAETELELFAKSVKVVPLSGNPMFEKYFLSCLEFPEHVAETGG